MSSKKKLVNRLVFGIIGGSLLLLPLLGGLFDVVYRKVQKQKTAKYVDHYTKKLPNTYFKYLQEKDEYENLIPTPYFGYTHASHKAGVNNYGFLETKNFPFSKGPKDFVIGLLGGEVAQNFGQFLKHHPLLMEQLSQALGKEVNVIVLNLAISGGKQPQQFMISSYFLELLDLTINLDGHNEVFYHDYVAFPVAYPWNSSWLYLTDPKVRSTHQRLLSILRLRSTLTYLPFQIIWLQKSVLYYTFWKWMLPKLDEFLVNTQEKLKEFPTAFKSENKDLGRQGVKLWSNFVLKQTWTQRSYSVPALFFLQPSLYVTGAKELSEEEKKYFLEAQDVAYKSKYYDLLRQEAQKLRQQGLQVYDLTMLFKGKEKTLYQDDVCEINDSGNELMAQEIIRTLEKLKAKGLLKRTKQSIPVN